MTSIAYYTRIFRTNSDMWCWRKLLNNNWYNIYKPDVARSIWKCCPSRQASDARIQSLMKKVSVIIWRVLIIFLHMFWFVSQHFDYRESTVSKKIGVLNQNWVKEWFNTTKNLFLLLHMAVVLNHGVVTLLCGMSFSGVCVDKLFKTLTLNFRYM